MTLARMQVRRGTAAQWTSANPVLLAGELGLETDTKYVKIGNGATAWNALVYLSDGIATLTAALLEADSESVSADWALDTSFTDTSRAIGHESGTGKQWAGSTIYDYVKTKLIADTLTASAAWQVATPFQVNDVSGTKFLIIKDENAFAAHDLVVQIYLNDTDTKPVLAFGSALNTLGAYGLGVGGNTNQDITLSRGATNLGDISGTITIRSRQRSTSVTGNAPTWNTAVNHLEVTAITGAINIGTNMTQATAPAHAVGDRLRIALTGNGTHGITFPALFEASSSLALPTALPGSGVRLVMDFDWNPATSKFRIISSVS